MLYFISPFMCKVNPFYTQFCTFVEAVTYSTER